MPHQKHLKQKIDTVHVFLSYKLSFGVGYLLFDDVLFRLGLFVMGCCPGGNASNFWCKLLGGDINLSITMTTISTVAALGKNTLIS